MQWPDGFIWGTASSSTQSEGAAPASDWRAWEQAHKAPPSGAGNGFSARFAEDFRLLAQLGLRHHRLSIDWARVEPQPGAHDHRAVSRYRDMLLAARDAGVVPWVCLHHFTLPGWFAAAGGFLTDRQPASRWARHVEYVAETFGDLAGGWQPVNEPNYYSLAAYRGRGWPPGHDNPAAWAAAAEAIHLATAEAAATLKQTGLPVASVLALSTEVTLDQTAGTAELARRLRAANWDAGLGLHRAGTLHVPGRAPIHRPDLQGCFDLIGFSYYATLGVRDGRITPYPAGAARSPLGYHIWADGLRPVLDRLHTQVPDTPILVAEFGVGTSDDQVRGDYITRCLQITSDAIARGIDIRGMFHWTSVDNYEWHHGYHVPFGLIDRDRKIRASGQILSREARRAR